MIQRVQQVLLSIGKTGCYFLSICYLYEAISRAPVVDLVLAYLGLVGDKMLGPDCMVLDGGGCLSSLTGQKWTCTKAGPGHPLPLEYECKPGEFEILRFERAPEAGDTDQTDRAHFVVGDGKGNVTFDPYGSSHTVAVGKLVSKRIFRRG